MAVDANIIMYERIKDELRIGRTLKQAYSKANKSSFLTIFDSNLTTVIALCFSSLEKVQSKASQPCYS